MKFSRQKMQHLKWVRRKQLIRINCFIMVALFLIVLLFMGFPIVSNADSPTYLKDKYFMHDLLNKEDFLSHNGEEGYYNFRSFILNTKAAILVGTYDYYEENYYDNVKKIFDNVSCNDLVSLDNNYIYDLSFFDTHDLFIFARDNDSDHLYFTFYNHDGYGISTGTDSQIYTINGASGFYYYYDLTNDTWGQSGASTLRYILYASGKTFVRDGSNKINDNYTYIDGSVGIGSGGANIVDNTPIIEHKKPYQGSCVYMQYSNLNTGNMHIVVKSDEFQKTENASIKLKCSVSAQTQYNSSVGIQESNVGVDGPFQNNFSSPNETFNIGPYVEYEIPLSSFNNSGDYTISLEDINKGLWNHNEKTLYSFNSCFQNNSTGLATAFKTFFFSILSTINIIPDYSNMPNFLYSLNSEVWDVQGVFCIGESEEIFDSFQLDMISGDIENQDYALPNEDDVKEVLDTPTVPNNYVPQPYKPSYPDAYNVTVPNNNTDVNNDNSNSNESNDNITVSGGENSVNVVTNINQGNKYPEKGVMQSFVRIINNDKNNTVNDLTTLTGANNYIALMNNALSVIPNEVWHVWLTALKAILGIVVSAFFLKILINWST